MLGFFEIEITAEAVLWFLGKFAEHSIGFYKNSSYTDSFGLFSIDADEIV